MHREFLCTQGGWPLSHDGDDKTKDLSNVAQRNVSVTGQPHIWYTYVGNSLQSWRLTQLFSKSKEAEFQVLGSDGPSASLFHLREASVFISRRGSWEYMSLANEVGWKYLLNVWIPCNFYFWFRDNLYACTMEVNTQTIWKGLLSVKTWSEILCV